MPNIMKSLIELGGDIANTQVANSGVGNTNILNSANAVLQGLKGIAAPSGAAKTEEDIFITADGKFVNSRSTELTGYVYIVTQQAAEYSIYVIDKVEKGGKANPFEETPSINFLLAHKDTRKLGFKNSLLSEPFDLPYSYFKRFAAVIFGEMGHYENSENEAKAIGCCIINALRMRFYYEPNMDNFERLDIFLTPRYTNAPNDPPYKNHIVLSYTSILKTPKMRTALMAALYALFNYALNNEIDISNGATHWDGVDFAQLGTQQDKPLNNGIYIANETHLINYARYWNTLVEKDKTRLKAFTGEKADKTSETLVKINDSSGNHEFNLSPNPYPAATGQNQGRILHISVAQYGGTIFWAPNYNEPLNNGYDWKGIVNYSK